MRLVDIFTKAVDTPTFMKFRSILLNMPYRDESANQILRLASALKRLPGRQVGA